MKRIVIALGHEALGTTLPEQQKATRKTAKAVAEFIQKDYQVIITHSNGPQVGMIHTAMAEFCRIYSGVHRDAHVRVFGYESGVHRL